MHAWPRSLVHPCVSSVSPTSFTVQAPFCVCACPGGRQNNSCPQDPKCAHATVYTHTHTHTAQSPSIPITHTPHSIFTLHTHHSTPARQHTCSSYNIHHTYTYNMCTYLTYTQISHMHTHFTCVNMPPCAHISDLTTHNVHVGDTTYMSHTNYIHDTCHET